MPPNHRRITNWFLGICLFLLIVLVRIPSISLPLDNDSGVIAYHARLILQGEPLYGTHHPTHHLPGAYYTYALIFKILGDRPESLKIALIPWVWLTAWAVYQIGRTVNSKTTGLIAAIFLILSSSMTNLAGDTVAIELLANLPLTLIIWIGSVYIKNDSPPVLYILIGVLGAISFLYKAVYLSSLTVICAVLLLQTIFEDRRVTWLDSAKKVAAILAGVLIVITPVALYFISVGYWDQLLLVFSLGTGYIGLNNSRFFLIILIPFYLVSKPFFLLTAFGTIRAGQITVLLKRTMHINREKGLFEFLFVIWLLGSVVASGFSKIPFPHYGLLVLPPLAVLSANGITELFQHFPKVNKLYKYATIIIFTILIAGNIINSSKAYLEGYIQYQSNSISLEEYLRNDVWLGDMNYDALEVANYIEKNTQQTDEVYGLTYLTQVYYMSSRNAPVNFLWPEYFYQIKNPEKIFGPNTVYIFLDPLAGKPPQLIQEGLNQFYKLEKTINGVEIYRRTIPYLSTIQSNMRIIPIPKTDKIKVSYSAT